MWLANNVKYLVLDDILELNTSLTIPLIDISIYILDVSAMSGYMIALAYSQTYRVGRIKKEEEAEKEEEKVMAGEAMVVIGLLLL